jgi:tRNA A37 threonylcarbamoyladenosine synthetase subunit TsaC/SUA5/YrdC
MPVLDIASNAARAFAVLRAGGIAILPMDVGYSVIGGSGAALRRIFETKRRAPSKLNAMIGHKRLHRELHACSPRGEDIVGAITEDYDLPLGVIAPCRPEHPMLRGLDAETYRRSTAGDTLLMLMNGGRLHQEISELSLAAAVPLFGSSANLSLGGTKFRPQDIEPEILAIADVVIDHGLVKYHPYRASSTLLDVESCTVHRFGSCYENIADIMRRHFKVELPPRPAT